MNDLIAGALSVYLIAFTTYLITRLKEIERQLTEIRNQECFRCNVGETVERIEAALAKLEKLIVSHNHTGKGVVLKGP